MIDVEGSHDEHPRDVPALSQKLAGGRHAVAPRHPDVHDDHVGVQSPGLCNCALAVVRLTDDLDVCLRIEDHREAGPHHRLVVG